MLVLGPLKRFHLVRRKELGGSVWGPATKLFGGHAGSKKQRFVMCVPVGT